MDLPDRDRFRNLSRTEVADFLMANKDSILRIARDTLKTVPRNVFDSDDVFASVARRLDELASRGSVRPRSEIELWAFISTVASGLAVDKMRLLSRIRSLESEGGQYAQLLRTRIERCASDDDVAMLIHRMALSLSEKRDRHVFYLKMRGSNDRSVGILLGESEAWARKRWYLIRQQLEDRFARGVLDDQCE